MLGLHHLPCERPTAPDRREPATTDTRWVLPAAILGSSLSFIDSSVVNVALPAIQNSLHTSLATMQWVVNAYMLTLASLILLGGSAGDRFGRRRVFLIGLAAFAGASFACGLAPSASWLVGGRLAQGAAAALLIPTSLAIIGAAYTDEARGGAIGTWAAAGALTASLGPPLGGWLVDTVGWRMIFFINLPIAALALLMGAKLPADPGSGGDEPMDARGGFLVVLALGALSYGLVAFGEGNASRGIIALAVAGPAVWLFLETEERSAASMMPLSLFRPELRGCECTDGAALRGSERGALPDTLHAHQGARLQRDGRGRGVPAVLGNHGRWIALVRRHGRAVRLEAPADPWSVRRRRWFCDPRALGIVVELLGGLSPRPDRGRDRDDPQRRAPHRHRVRLRPGIEAERHPASTTRPPAPVA